METAHHHQDVNETISSIPQCPQSTSSDGQTTSPSRKRKASEFEASSFVPSLPLQDSPFSVPMETGEKTASQQESAFIYEHLPQPPTPKRRRRSPEPETSQEEDAVQSPQDAPSSSIHTFRASSFSAEAFPPTLAGLGKAERPRAKSLPLILSTSTRPFLAPKIVNRRPRVDITKVDGVPLSHTELTVLHELNLPSIAPGHRFSRFTGSAYQGRSSIARQTPSLVIIPSLKPPVTCSTLRELDLAEILRSKQLRHDIVFDPQLCFRPNSEGERGAKAKANATRYWQALSRELETGCRCTAFDNTKESADDLMLSCICHNDILNPSNSLVTKLPSRIPLLITELRDITLSLLPASPSSKNTLHSSRETISNLLDVNRIVSSIAHSQFNLPAIAGRIAAIIKLHCAPIRDKLVDEMAGLAKDGTIIDTLRKCFEVLELMKLDVANHQLKMLQPFMLMTAAPFELSSFLDSHPEAHSSPDSLSRTVSWITGRPMLNSILDLVFSPDQIQVSPTQASRKSRKTSARYVNQPNALQLPETLLPDIYRLQNLHGEIIDQTIIYMLLLFHRQLVPQASVQEQLQLKQELRSFMSASSLLHSRNGQTVSTFTGLKKLACPKWRNEMQNVMFELVRRCSPTAVPSLDTVKLAEAWFATNIHPTAPLFEICHQRHKNAVKAIMASLIDSEGMSKWWLHPTMASDVFSRSEKQLGYRCTTQGPREAIKIEARHANGEFQRDTEVEEELKALIVKNGLGALEHEVQGTAERIAKLTTYHFEVFGGLYQEIMKHYETQE